MSQDAGMTGATGYTPKGIGDILKSAFEVYGAHWQRLLTIAAVLIIPVTIIIDLLFYLVLVNSLSGTAVAIAGSLTGALAWILFTVVQAGITRGAASALVGNPGVDEAFQWGLKHVFSFLWIAILIGLIIAAPVILALLLFFLSAGLGAALTFIAIIAAIFVGTMLAVAIPSLVIEGRRGTDALARSWELVKGHFWHVFGAMFVAGLIAAVVTFVIQAIFGSSLNFLVRTISDILTYIITIPFTTLVAIVLYRDLRGRVENVSDDTIRAELQASGGTGGAPGALPN